MPSIKIYSLSNIISDSAFHKVMNIFTFINNFVQIFNFQTVHYGGVTGNIYFGASARSKKKIIFFHSCFLSFIHNHRYIYLFKIH